MIRISSVACSPSISREEALVQCLAISVSLPESSKLHLRLETFFVLLAFVKLELIEEDGF